MAIYNGLTGTLIKKLGLSNFLTESDIYNLPHSTSSIQWHGEHQIDYKKNLLILRVVKPAKDEQFFDVHIDLRNGEVLDEVTDRIPSLQFLLSSRVVEESNLTSPLESVPSSSCAAKEGAISISSAELTKRILSKELPEYPPAARAVRASGESVFELVVSEDGDVECVSAISGHPLLRAVITNSLMKWKFHNNHARFIGKIVVEGKYAHVLNGTVVE